MVSGDRAETAAMERLRDRMTRELRVRGMAERTVSAYVDDVRLLVFSRVSVTQYDYSQ